MNTENLNLTEFLAKFGSRGHVINANCLRDFACPNCGGRTAFVVNVTTFADLSDDGTDANVRDHEWGDMSPMRCLRCDHARDAWEFRVVGLDDYLTAQAAPPSDPNPT